ncbi:esterase/lipase family protein [Rheinheimera mangrovi]|uniref:esterase/lipase family protein n=1 Tax=Rheinheimera mangrovi TaxID=2498451 RepID=UPI000F8DBE90|nr:alpha/beta hydrolase [Rheinheimera mangrovi]
MQTRLKKISLFLLCLFLLAGCTSPHFLKLLPSTKRALEANQLFSYQYARMQQMDAAELALYCPDLLSLPDETANKSLLQLSCAQFWLSSSHLTNTELQQATTLYNQSLTHFLQLMLPKQKYRHPALRIVLEPPLDETGLPFENFVLASDFQAIKSHHQKIKGTGLGVSLVAARENTGTGWDKNYPPEGIFRSVTVSLKELKFNKDLQIQLTLQGHLMQEATELRFTSASYPLLYDAASSYLWLIQQAKLADLELPGLFNAELADNKLGIYSVTPLQKNKQPLLMIHGLNSSPLIWYELTMAVLQDEELKQRYQIWHAFYPSGPPPFYNSMRLRKKLDELHSMLNAKGDSEVLDQMLVVGHSMGGIISKTLVQNTDFVLWDLSFTERPEQLGYAQQEMEKVKDIFIFNTRPYIDKVVFMDTPHGGSESSESILAKIASWFINLPKNFTLLMSNFILKLGPDKITLPMREYLNGGGGPHSVQVLSPRHPLLQGLNRLTYQRPVYSIVGSDGPLSCQDERSCSQISDGVVPFFSAHQNKAVQEIIVSSRHNSYQSPQALEFLLQVLRQPAGEAKILPLSPDKPDD